MGRPRRIDFEGAVHHVTARGDAGRAIYLDDIDRETFLWVLTDVAAEVRWVALAYCLMGNHFHLLVETPDAGLARGMHLLSGRYGRRFRGRHGGGHLFGGRYWSVLVRDQRQLAATLRYIVMNPVSAEMAGRPGDWAWSSHRATVHRAPGLVDHRRLLQLLVGTERQNLDSYRDLIGDGDELIAPPRAMRRPPALAELLREDTTEAIVAAYLEHGYSIRAIAAALGRSPATVQRRLRAR